MAMMAITTSNSMSVNPRSGRRCKVAMLCASHFGKNKKVGP
jgi:hypothetical protein